MARVRCAQFDVANIHRILSIWDYKLPDLIAAIHICFVVDWGPRTRAAVTVTRINRPLERVRDSRDPIDVYRYLLAHVHAAPDQSGSFPYDLEEWRMVIVKSSLFSHEENSPDLLPFCAI